MATKPKHPSVAVRAIVTAITKGTKKMKAKDFFWALHHELKQYRPAKHDAFIKFLRRAGVAATPTRTQVAAAAKIARRRENVSLAAHALAADESY